MGHWVNGRMVDKTDLDYTEFLNDWDVSVRPDASCFYGNDCYNGLSVG
jgi:hypothetical protein